MYADCIRRGVFGRLDSRRYTKPEGAHVSGGATAMLQSLCKQPGTGGFPVGPRDADNRHCGRWRAEETIGDCANVLTQLWNGRDEDIGAEVRLRSGGLGCVFVQHRTRAPGNGLFREAQSVARATLAGQKQRTR